MYSIGKPLINFVVCIKVANSNQEQKFGSIVIPEMNNEDKASIYEVVSVGDGFFTNEGVLIKTTLKPGDIVVLPALGGQKLKLNKEEFVLIREDLILTTLKRTEK